MKNLILALAILMVFSCNSTPPDYVDIDWTGGQSFSYSYSGGVPSGGTWYNKFVVTDGSGDVTFKVYVNGNKKKTETFTVEEDLIYKVRVSISTSSCGYSNSATVEIKSSSVSSPRKLSADCSNIGIGSISVSEITD